MLLPISVELQSILSNIFFIFFATIGAVVWVTVFLSLGNRLGANWGIIADFIRKYSWSIVGTLILIIVVCITYYRYRKQHT